MRNHSILVQMSIFFVFIIIMLACNEQQPTNSGKKIIEDPLNSSPPISLTDTINLIGIHHNECLDTLLSRFERVKAGEEPGLNMSWQSYTTIIAYEFAGEKGWDEDYMDTNDIDYDNNNSVQEILANYPTLSATAQQLLQKLDLALNLYFDSDDLTVFSYTCDSIITESVNNLDRLEAIAVGAGASVGKNSAIYWSNNNNWLRLEEMLAPLEGIKKKNEKPTILANKKQKAVMSSDIGGAIAGAVDGAVAGATVGSTLPGVGTAVGAIGGAVSGALIGGGAKSMVRGVAEAVTGGNVPWWLQWL
jgi:hypothetical protein